MSSTKSFTAKTTPITYDDVPAYKPTTDFYAALAQASSTQYKTANQYQINVLPDFTPILMTILYHANLFAANFETVDHPKVTVATFTAYCLNLVYAFFLVHDYELNFQPSEYAQSLLVHRNFEKYYEHLQSMPVPAFLVTIFERLQQTLLDKQKTILVTPSMNGFSHYTHFGRFYPIDIFFGIHDTIASFDARSAVLQNIQDYELRTVFTVTSLNVTPLANATNVANYEYRHSHFFASYFPTDPTAASAPQSANTRVNQFLGSIFKMEHLRNIQSRQRAVPIGLNPVTVANGFYNPYVVMMSLTANNIAELTTVFDSVSSVLLEKKLATVNFASVITQSTSKILIHGYSDFALPHWNANFFDNNAHLPTLARVQNITPEAYATRLHFLANFTPATPINTWNVRSNTLLDVRLTLNTAGRDAIRNANGATVSLATRNIHQHRHRVENAAQTLAITPATIDHTTDLTVPAPANPVPTTPAAVTAANLILGTFNVFDPANSVYPLVKYYDTIDYAPTTAHLSGLAGLIIYSEELCASTVPMLSSLSKTSDDNNQFLQSAIPYAMTVLAINFRTRNPVPARAIARLASTALTQVCLTMFRRANVVYDSTASRYTFDTGMRRINYGQTRAEDQAIPQFNQTVIGHNVSTGRQIARNAPNRFSPPATPAGTLLVWSPYSFVDSTLDPTDIGSSHHFLNRLHFITNFRTLFGTTGQVYEAASPIEAIPMP